LTPRTPTATARRKIGKGLSDVRKDIVIATKSTSLDPKLLRRHVELSLARLRTDYIDIEQLHNAAAVPDAESPVYQELQKLKAEGKINHIGITTHKLKIAVEAVESGLYETVQFPLSCLSSEEEFDMVRLAKKRNVGIICMKAMSGGLLTSAAPSMAVLDQFDNAVPIFGIQRVSELSEVLALDANPPKLDEAMIAYIETEKRKLSGSFCRGCGYCLPCPAGIKINMVARMSLLLERSPWEPLVTPQSMEDMIRIEACIRCGACKKRCPYGLDCPKLIGRNLVYYRNFLREKGLAQ
jgi:predicted aldo/keto reductase-like oxidoreductase